jgi:nucleoside-diphosphate-sugar epimerase
VLFGYPKQPSQFFGREVPPKSDTLYGLTKVCQEIVAEHYQRMHQLSVSALRVGWVMDADTMIDKYNRSQTTYQVGFSDRRDIGDAARLALERGAICYDVFYVESTPESADRFDIAYTKRTLGWEPKYDFKWLPSKKT